MIACMAKLPILHSRPNAQEELILVGFRLDPNHDGPQLYTVLAVGGENERPAMWKGRILFFTHPSLVAKAQAMDASISQLTAPGSEIETFCDVAETLHLVNATNADSDGVVLDCLLIFDDLVRATHLHMPDRYQGMLTELAAHLTEGRSLGKIFTNQSLREHVEDALMWCVGAIVLKSQIIT